MPWLDETGQKIWRIIEPVKPSLSFAYLPRVATENKELNLESTKIQKVLEGLNHFDYLPLAHDQKGFTQKFHALLSENSFLYDLNKLENIDDELFLRRHYLNSTIFPLTTRYVDHLEKNGEEATQVAKCYRQLNSKALHTEIDKLPAEYQEKAKKLLGISEKD